MMKKCIGLICSALLFAVLVAGCSDSTGSENKDGNGGGGVTVENPFIGTKWNYAGSIASYKSLKLSFDNKDMTVKYYNGHTNVTFNYSWQQDSESKKYVANLENGPATMTFEISDVDAAEGELDGVKYTRSSY